MVSFVNQDPLAIAQQQEIERRMAMAQALQQQAMKPIQAQEGLKQMPKISPWQGLAQLGQALIAGREKQSAQNDALGLAKEQQGMMQEGRSAMADYLMGQAPTPRPAQNIPDAGPGDAVSTSTVLNGNEGDVQGFKDKQRELLTKMLVNPYTHQEAQALAMKQYAPSKVTYTNAGDRLIGHDESGKIVSTVPIGESANNAANRTNVKADTLFSHGTESANNRMNRTTLSADQQVKLNETLAKMRDQGIDTSIIEQGLGMPPRQSAPPNIPPEVLAAAQSGKPFVMTQAPGQAPVSQPIPPGASLPPAAARQNALHEANTRSDALVKAQASLPQIESTATQTLKLVDDLVKHPGMKDVVGIPDNPLALKGYMPGTKAADFKSRYEQILGKQFMTAYETLKGGGSITEVEGKKGTDAIAAMQTAQSEKSFLAAARDFKEVVQNGLNNARRSAGKPPIEFSKEPNESSGRIGKVLRFDAQGNQLP